MSISPTDKYRVLSGSWLKLIAVVTMLTDHIGAYLLAGNALGATVLFSFGARTLTLYQLMRAIGRTAFPIYCFLISEGSRYTSNRLRYGINLGIFALVSEIPWNLVHCGKLLYAKQNVFFTLLLGYLFICVYDTYRDKPLKFAVFFTGLIACALLMKADYGLKGAALVFMFYFVREWFPQLLFGIPMLGGSLRLIPAFVLIRFYNGERGFIHGKTMKYAFYVFYPLHLFILYLIRQRMAGAV